MFIAQCTYCIYSYSPEGLHRKLFLKRKGGVKKRESLSSYPVFKTASFIKTVSLIDLKFVTSSSPKLHRQTWFKNYSY